MPTYTTATGVAPLALLNSIAYGIKSLTQYGKCTQASTPTPDAPVDIVCNNGALRMLNLANMAESNLDIGYYLNNNGVRTSSPSNFYTLGFIPIKASTDYTIKTSEILNYFNIMEYDSAQGFLKRTLWGSSGSPAGDTITFTTRSDTAFIRFGSNMNGNTLTYADIAAVTWMLTEGATAQDYVPYGQLSVVGTPEVLTVFQNLYDERTMFTTNPMAITGGTLYWRYAEGSTAAAILVPCKPNTEYTLKYSGGNRCFIGGFINEVDLNPSESIACDFNIFSNSSAAVSPKTFTTPANCNYLAIGLKNSAGTAVSDIAVFETAQTVNDVRMLFGLDDTYRDAEELIGGLLTHKGAVLVLDGSGDWFSASDNVFQLVVPTIDGITTKDTPCLCTHYLGIVPKTSISRMDDLTIKAGYNNTSNMSKLYIKDSGCSTPEELKTKLTAQYAAGTPVIVIYPLAEETTEQGTAHNLHTTAGDTVVSVTSNVDPVTLEAEYANGYE